MAEHSRFFDSLNPLEPDQTYTAEEFTSYFRALITTGIMKGTANMLKVETSGSNMNTTVDTGTAFLIGRQYENDSKLSLTHEVEALGKSRIDRVVLRLVLDMDARYIKAFVKKGVAGTAPVAPPLARTGNVYEISLAQVKVIGGQTYINASDVVDERGNADVAPWAGSKILPNFDDAALEDLINRVDTGLVDATTSRKGIVQLNNTLNSSSVGEAATANAVKQLNDKINDNGYVTLPPENNFELNLGSWPIRVRRIGSLAGVEGSVRIRAPLSGNSITTLPVSFRPRSNFIFTILRIRNGVYTPYSGLCNGSSLLILSEQMSNFTTDDVVYFNFTYLINE